MPIDIIRLDNGTGLLLRCHDALSGKDKIEVNEVLLSSPERLRALRYMVIDEESVGFVLSTSEARTVAEQDRQIAKLAPEGLVVAVVTPRDVDFGMARMWQVFVEGTGWKTEVFRSRESAAVWLDKTVGENSYLSLPATSLCR
jgi:hypothetical protein